MGDLEITDALDAPPELRGKGGTGNAVIDVGVALKLRMRNQFTYSEIAAYVKATTGVRVSKQAVHDRLKPFIAMIEDPTAIQAYQDNKANLLSGVELKLLTELLDTDKIKGASLNNVAYAVQQINNMRLAEVGKLPIQAENLTFNVVYNDNRTAGSATTSDQDNSPINITPLKVSED